MEINLDGEKDCVLTGDSVWVTVKNLSVRIAKTDEGVVVDIYPLKQENDEPITTTYAYFREGGELCQNSQSIS